MLDDPRSQEIEVGEHQGQREEDGDESSGQSRGSEVGAEATPIHEKTGMKTEWEAAPGLQDHRASENSERTRDSVLVLQAIEGAINFGTPVRTVGPSSGVSHVGLSDRRVVRQSVPVLLLLPWPTPMTSTTGGGGTSSAESAPATPPGRAATTCMTGERPAPLCSGGGPHVAGL